MKTENTKVQVRKKALEYCILVQVDNKPFHVCDIIRLVKESKVIIEEKIINPHFKHLNADNLYRRLDDSNTQSADKKVHLLWLWTGILNTDH
ncbi:MAG: hypothetical protein K0M40_22445 [Prolixibacteraceae bacterium]|nr:hypothetical protein [Prolixibacteraceae bacterium]